MKCLILTVLAVVFSLCNAKVRYDDYQVYQVFPETKEQLDILRELQNSRDSYNFWTEVTHLYQPVRIMVAPHLRAEFQEIMRRISLIPELKIENIQRLINEENYANRKASLAFDWKRYQTLGEIYDWLRSLEQKYPNTVKVVKGGESYEGREILGVKITFKSENKGVFIEGGIHAREWLSPATVTFIANELLTSNDPKVRRVAESRTWYIFPNANPDGYVYTHTTNRLWRKTRKPYGICYGTDPNRNWGYKWNQGGVSNNPCFDTYAGSSAFSDVETRTLSEYISTFAHTLDAYLSFHAFAQVILIPFGHSGLEVPENNDELHRVGNIAAKALAKRYGTEYRVGNIPEIMYVASGSSLDWAVGKYKNIRFPYAYELRDNGTHGFILPPDQIIPTGEETLDSLVSIFQQADA